MPELPEVETFKRYLDATSLHKTIRKVTVNRAKILQGISSRRLVRELRGHRMEATLRRGKHLLIRLDSGKWLTMHFGMTGHLKYSGKEQDKPPHDRLVIFFDNGCRLAFVNARLFGRIGLVDDPDDFYRAHRLGPDALELDADAFRGRLDRRAGAIKAALLDQSVMAGIGNIYADEILHRARIHPRTRITNLTEKQVDLIFRSMVAILRTAIRCKGDIGCLPRSWLARRRGLGRSCPSCKRALRRITLSSRSTYFCAHCQPQVGDRH